jgi:hypothetical protein
MKRTNLRQAAALPLVLWCIAFIAGLVVLLAGSVSSWMDSETRAEKKFIARQMALSGIAIGQNPLVKPGDPLLGKGSRNGEGFEVKITNESAKLNPNFWIQNNNRSIFIRLFTSWGADIGTTDAAIDSLIDWIDGDDFLSLKGAERGEYERAGKRGYPANRPLKHIREMEAVMNLSPLLSAKDGWQNYFTIWYSGKISIQHATESSLTALAEFTPMQCHSLLEMRAGQDGIDGTDDDQKLTSLEDVASFLGLGSRQRAGLLEFFDTSGDLRCIESTGWCGGVAHKITVVSGADPNSQMMSWEEK